VALGETLIAEACRKDAPDCGDERAAAGQEHTVDIAGIDALPDEEVVDGLLDAGDVVGYPALEIFSRDALVYVEPAKFERESRAFGWSNRSSPSQTTIPRRCRAAFT
jgi:hypothetical protein